MSILLTVSFVILDQPAPKATNKLAQLGNLHPGLATKLLTIVYSEDNR